MLRPRFSARALAPALAALLTVLLLVGISGAAGRAKPRPVLQVVSGRISPVAGRLRGSFSVRDVDRRVVNRSLAELSVSAGHVRWVVRVLNVKAFAPGRTDSFHFAAVIPSRIPAGLWPILACASVDPRVFRGVLRESCRTVGRLRIAARPATVRSSSPPAGATRTATSPAPGATVPTTTTTTTTTTTSTTTATATPASTATTASGPPPPPEGAVPTDPVSDYTIDSPFEIDNGASDDYWVNVPSTYDPSGHTPIKLLVWLHGCQGVASDDALNWADLGPNRDYMILSLDGATGTGGRECFDTTRACLDCPKVLAAVANIETHFNIDRHRIILGGFSSGGDLAYRTIFYHANEFAGLLVQHTSPFDQTGSTQSQSLAASARLFPIVHLANSGDEDYPIATVLSELATLQSTGYPVQLIEITGGTNDHYVGGDNTTPGSTRYNYLHYVLPHIDDGWWAPGS